MKVKQAMQAGAQWGEPGTSLAQLARLMQQHNIGAIPIGENDRLVGVPSFGEISRASERALCGEIVQAVAARAA